MPDIASFCYKAAVAVTSPEKENHSNVKPFIETPRATNPIRQSQASSRKHTRPDVIVSEPTPNLRRARLAPTRFVKRLDLHGSGSEPS